jgi:hypothetical protein
MNFSALLVPAVLSSTALPSARADVELPSSAFVCDDSQVQITVTTPDPFEAVRVTWTEAGGAEETFFAKWTANDDAGNATLTLAPTGITPFGHESAVLTWTPSPDGMTGVHHLVNWVFDLDCRPLPQP